MSPRKTKVDNMTETTTTATKPATAAGGAIMQAQSISKQVKTARERGVPLVAIRCGDPRVTLHDVALHGINGQVFPGAPTTQFVWDCVRGLSPLGEKGGPSQQVFSAVLEGKTTIAPPQALMAIRELPENAVVFFLNLHRFLDNPQVMQCLFNLRDEYKRNGRMAILLSTDLKVPNELQNDVIVFDEALPDRERMRVVVDGVVKAAQASLPSLDVPDSDIEHTIDAFSGLTEFAAEQAAALSLTPKGMNVKAAWERKKQMIEQTPGIKILQPSFTFADVGGCERIKRFAKNLMEGPEAPKVFLFCDEVEKMTAGATGQVGDSSGVSQDAFGQFLTWTERGNRTGAMFNGVAGCSKTMIAEAWAGTYDRPMLTLDFGAMKGGIVGQSEQYVRKCLDTIEAIAGTGPGSAYLIATCNKLHGLPPEFLRRFADGIFYFGIPEDEDEYAPIWAANLKRFDIDPNQTLPIYTRWTGADIRNCCRFAYRLNTTLLEAAKEIVPVAQSDPAMIAFCEEQAHGRFKSASYDGTFESRTRRGESSNTDSPARGIHIN